MIIVIETVNQKTFPLMYNIEVHGKDYQRYSSQFKHEVVHIIERILKDDN